MNPGFDLHTDEIKLDLPIIYTETNTFFPKALQVIEDKGVEDKIVDLKGKHGTAFQTYTTLSLSRALKTSTRCLISLWTWREIWWLRWSTFSADFNNGVETLKLRRRFKKQNFSPGHSKIHLRDPRSDNGLHETAKPPLCLKLCLQWTREFYSILNMIQMFIQLNIIFKVAMI